MGKAKRKPSDPGRKKRKVQQDKRRGYMKLREELQVSGDLPVSAEGAIRDERVDPASQSEQQFPKLVQAAIRNKWATPDEVKPKLVDALIRPFFEKEVRVDKDGNQVEVSADPFLLKENFKALMAADKFQHEQDNPEAAGKAKGGVSVNVNNQVAVLDPYELYKRRVEELRREQADEHRMGQVEDGGGGPERDALQHDDGREPGAGPTAGSAGAAVEPKTQDPGQLGQ